jgi:polysaccharide biosynthesis transport protein
MPRNDSLRYTKLDDEIDLRPYIAALLKNWYWIVGSGIVAGLAALIVSLLLPPTYEATALVAITRPRYVLQFDPRFQNVTNIQPVYRAYPELATSDAVLQELRESRFVAADEQSLSDLRQMASAAAGSDPSLVRLAIKADNPEAAAAIANQWADIYVQRANELFGNQSADQVAFFEAQLTVATADMEQRQAAITAFQGQNRSAILETQLLSYSEIQIAYLTRQQRLVLLQTDIQGFQEQVGASQTTTAADQLTALLLQLQTFGVGETAVLQLQLSGSEAVSALSPAEQQLLLANLATAVSAAIEQINQKLANLEPEILAAQAELQQLTGAYSRLEQDLTIAQQTYATLSHKLEEARLTTEGVGSEVQLASYAAVPEKPVGQSKAISIAIAAIVGLLFSMAGVILYQWSQETKIVRESAS